MLRLFLSLLVLVCPVLAAGANYLLQKPALSATQIVFSYAGDLSPRSHKLGWVLAKKPGIVLNFIKKMHSLLGDQAGRLQELVQGTIRLECQILQEECDGKRSTFYSREQLQDGLAILHAHLRDGRWAMDEYGNWRHPWRFDTEHQQWVCDVG